MNAKHTPGPWHVDGQWIIGYPQSDIAVAKTVNGVGQPSEANARLIAAAPELLEAAKALVWQLNTDYSLSPGASMLCRKMEHAIAKAEGSAE